MDFFNGHLNGFIVDCIFIVLFFALHVNIRNKVSLSALILNIVVPLFAYLYLFLVRYMHEFNVDYNIIMAGFLLAFSIHILMISNGYGLFLCALGLNFLLHSVMLVKEPMQQMYLISPRTYTAIYDSYEPARIIVVSLQLMGLLLGGKYGRYDDTDNRLRSNARRIIDCFRVYTISLLRVKRS